MLVAALALGVLTAALAPFPQIEIARGVIAPEAGLIEVTAPRAGIVETVALANAADVRRGDIVAVVRVAPDIASGQAGAALLESLKEEETAGARLAALEVATLEDERRESMEERRGVLADLERLRAQQALQSERVALVESQVRRGEDLAQRGFYPERQLEENRTALLNAKQAQLGFERETLALGRNLREVEHRIEMARDRIRQSEARAQQLSSQIAQRRVTASTDDRYLLRATASGVIDRLSLKRGQRVAADAPVAVIVPERGTLQLEAQVTSRARARIRRGQAAYVEIDAFPSHRYGPIRGRVRQVEGVATSEAGADPSYRVLIELDRNQRGEESDSIKLLPGMQASARIVTRRGSFVDVLMRKTQAA